MKNNIPSSILGFSFWGTGNVGDDLMLAGFLKAYSGPHLTSFQDASKCSTLQRRFPSVSWLQTALNNSPIGNFVDWLGVGDTPFQAKRGDWFLRYMELESKSWWRKVNRVAFLNVGAEEDAIRYKDRFLRVIDGIESISTRDPMTASILVEGIGAPPEKVQVAADLANLFLCDLFPVLPTDSPRPVKVAINFYLETLPIDTLIQLGRELRRLLRDHSCVFLNNETRYFRNSELAIFGHLASAVNFRMPRKLELCQPAYRTASVKALVDHFQDFEIVISSRYHCLLTAAWAGCKVCALSRSSKIDGLCEELGIPMLNSRLKANSLSECMALAKTVDRSVLESLAKRSLNGLSMLESKSLP